MSTCTQHKTRLIYLWPFFFLSLLIQKIKMLMDVFWEFHSCVKYSIGFATQNGNNILIDLLVKLSVNLVRTSFNPKFKLHICCRYIAFACSARDHSAEEFLSATHQSTPSIKCILNTISHIRLSLFSRHWYFENISRSLCDGWCCFIASEKNKIDSLLISHIFNITSHNSFSQYFLPQKQK